MIYRVLPQAPHLNSNDTNPEVRFINPLCLTVKSEICPTPIPFMFINIPHSKSMMLDLTVCLLIQHLGGE